MMVLITNKNKPKVKMVMGKVKKINIGLTTILNKPKTMATYKAAFKSVTITPFKKFEIINTAKAVNTSLKIIFIVVVLLINKLKPYQLYFMLIWQKRSLKT